MKHTKCSAIITGEPGYMKLKRHIILNLSQLTGDTVDELETAYRSLQSLDALVEAAYLSTFNGIGIVDATRIVAGEDIAITYQPPTEFLND